MKFAKSVMFFYVFFSSSIGFEYAIISAEDGIHKHNSHPSVIKVEESLARSTKFALHAVFSEINQQLVIINFKKATGCDNILGKIWGLAHNELTTPLTSLINDCTKCGILPENINLQKWAQVIRSPIIWWKVITDR